MNIEKSDPTAKVTELFTEHADSLLRMCFLYLKDMGLAEDAVSETFVKAFRSFDSFSCLSSEKTWLTRIAINCCKNIIRTREYRIKHLDFSFAENVPDLDKYGDIDNRVSVSVEVGKLPLKEREVVLLHYYNELSTAEIAKLLGVPRTTVDYRLRQARKQLKKQLKEDYFP